MKILNWDGFLEEVQLNLSELGKIDSHGDSRGNKLVDKLKNRDKIITNDNREVVVSKMKDNDEWVDPEIGIHNIINDDGKYDLDKAKDYFRPRNTYKKVFKSGYGDELSLNQLKKTIDFGSKGAGRLIRKFESCQSIFIAIKQDNPGYYLTQYNILPLFYKFIGDLDRVNKYLHLPKEIVINDDLVDYFLKNKDWVSTFLRVPNMLFKPNLKLVDANQKYSVYHVGYDGDDSPYLALYKKYRQIAISGGFSDINISKYCPADVFLSAYDLNHEIVNQIKGVKDIHELTELLDDLFREKKLIPVSLKKIGVNDRFKIIINKEEDRELPDFFIQSFNIGSDMRGIGSKIGTKSIWRYKNKNVDVKDRLINFDSSDTSKKQNVDGEVEGSYSRHGKISFNSINRMINQSLSLFDSDRIDKLQNYSYLSEMSVDDLEKMVSDLIEKIKNQGMPSDFVIIRPVRGFDISNNKNKLISRIQSLQIILIFSQMYQQNKKETNNLITHIMRYALSIQTDKFDTPRYLRVI